MAEVATLRRPLDQNALASLMTHHDDVSKPAADAVRLDGWSGSHIPAKRVQDSAGVPETQKAEGTSDAFAPQSMTPAMVENRREALAPGQSDNDHKATNVAFQTESAETFAMAASLAPFAERHAVSGDSAQQEAGGGDLRRAVTGHGYETAPQWSTRFPGASKWQGRERGAGRGGQGSGRGRGGGSAGGRTYLRNRDNGRGRKSNRFKRRSSGNGQQAPHPLGLDYGEPSRGGHDQGQWAPRSQTQSHPPKRAKLQGSYEGPALGPPVDLGHTAGGRQHLFSSGTGQYQAQQQPGSGKRHRKRRRGPRTEPVLEDGEFRPPRLRDLKQRNRVNTRKFFSRNRPSGAPDGPADVAALSDHPVTIISRRSSELPIAAPALPTPSPKLLPTPLLTASPLPWAAMTPSMLTPGHAGHKEDGQEGHGDESDLHGLRVNPYGSMNGCLRLFAPEADEGEEDEEEERDSMGSHNSAREREGHALDDSYSSGRTVEQGAQTTHSSNKDSDGHSSSSETQEGGGGAAAGGDRERDSAQEGGAVCGGEGVKAKPKKGRVRLVSKPQALVLAPAPQRLQMQMVFAGGGGAGGGMRASESFLRARVDEQEAQLAQLEEENLTLRERLYVAEQELKELRRRLGEGGGADDSMGECEGETSGDDASFAPG